MDAESVYRMAGPAAEAGVATARYAVHAPGRLVRALGLVLLAATGAGCATGEADAGAAAGREQLCARQLCTRLMQDLRLYCKQDVVRGDHAAASMDCLSRRLEFEQACF